MRAHEERETEHRPEPLRRADAASRAAGPAPSPVMALADLQRTAGNAAVVRLLAGRRGLFPVQREAVVQRAPIRRQTERRAARRQAALDSPYARRPRSARQQEQQGFDPALPRPRELPREGPDGAAIWSGTRADIGFTDETRDAVLEATASRKANGRTEYLCAKCGAYIPRKGDRTPADGNRHVTIDHMSGIIEYVHSKAEVLSWEVDGRRVQAISLEEAKKWANDAENLRVLCAQPCNGGKRAARSGSRHYDTARAVWWAD